MFRGIARVIRTCVVGNFNPGKLGLQSLGFLVNFDVDFKNFPGNYDWSGQLSLEKVQLTSLAFLVKQDSKSLKKSYSIVNRSQFERESMCK